MSILVDVAYAGRIAYLVKNHRVKNRNPYLANFSCPVCGDGERSSRSTRGYIYTRNNGLRYYCHNCSYGCRLGGLLEFLNRNLYMEYKMEVWREGNEADVQPTAGTTENAVSEKCDIFRTGMISLGGFDEGHPAVTYVLGRHVPRQRLDDLYYVPHDANFNIGDVRYRGDVDRVVIPIRNATGGLVGITCRDLTGTSRLRYRMLRLCDEPMIYGLDRVGPGTVWVLEGPFDAMMFDNGVSPCGANLDQVNGVMSRTRQVRVYDNQPRNRELLKLMRRSIDEGVRVVVWPEETRGKDPGEMAMNGDDPVELCRIHSYRGNRALLEFLRWKKIDSPYEKR